MNINMSFFEGVQLSVISMLIVFLLLYVISLVLSVFKLVFKEKSVEKKVIAKTVTTPAKVVANTKGITFEELEKDQDMLVAAIVASMEATGENKTFENVVLTGIEYTEEASESLVFDLSFEQIRLVSYGTVNTVAIKTQPSKNIGANMKKRVNTEKSSSEGEYTITPAFKQE